MDKVYWMILTIVIGGTGLVVFMAVYMTQYWHPAYSIISAAVIIFLTGLYLNPEYLKPMLQLLPERIRRHGSYEMIIVLEERFHNSQGRVLFGLTALIYAMILLECYLPRSIVRTSSLYGCDHVRRFGVLCKVDLPADLLR